MKIDFSVSSPWSETCSAVPSREDSACGPSIESDSSLPAAPWTETYCDVAVTSSSPSNVNGSVYGAGPSPLTSASCLSSNDLWSVNDLTCIASEQHNSCIGCMASLPPPGRGASLSSLWLVRPYSTSCFSPNVLLAFLALFLLWLTILRSLLLVTSHGSVCAYRCVTNCSLGLKCSPVRLTSSFQLLLQRFANVNRDTRKHCSKPVQLDEHHTTDGPNSGLKPSSSLQVNLLNGSVCKKKSYSNGHRAIAAI